MACGQSEFLVEEEINRFRVLEPALSQRAEAGRTVVKRPQCRAPTLRKLGISCRAHAAHRNQNPTVSTCRRASRPMPYFQEPVGRAPNLVQLQGMTDELRIRELLEEILESGSTPEEACAKFPDLLPEVCKRWKRVRRVAREFDALFPSSTGGGVGIEMEVWKADLQAGRRYSAAWSAAMAGCGSGADGASISEEERARWREQARDWLRGDLAAWSGRLTSGAAKDSSLVVQNLTAWRTDPELAGLREPAALEALSAEEREDCIALWDEVEVILKRARGPD